MRFFERVKLERRLQRLQAQLAAAEKAAAGRGGDDADAEKAAGSTAGASAEQLQQQVAAVKEDLEYVLHFPKAEKYVSLLRQADTPEAQVGAAAAGWDPVAVQPTESLLLRPTCPGCAG